MTRRRLLYGAVPVALVLTGLVLRPSPGPSAAPPPARPEAVTSPGSVVPSPGSFPAETAASPTVSPRLDRRSGGGARPGTTPPSAPPSSGPPPSSPTRPDDKHGDPGTASLDDALRRHDPVPPGVAEQISVFSGGGTGCTGILPDPLSVGVTEVRTIPSVPVICVKGFGDADLTVTVTTPSGRTRVFTSPHTPEGLHPPIPFPLPPGSEPGLYRVRADENKESAFTEFKVERATEPTLWITPEHASPGDDVEVLIGGFPPSRPVRLHLYVCGERFRYRTTLTAPADATGAGRLTLRTSARTPEVCFAVINPLVYDPLVPEAGSLPANLQFWID